MKRGNDRADRDLAGACVPVAGDALLFGPFNERVDDRSASLRVLQRYAELVDRLVEQEAGWDEALGLRRADALEFTVELAGILREAVEIGLGIGRALNLMGDKVSGGQPRR